MSHNSRDKHLTASIISLTKWPKSGNGREVIKQAIIDVYYGSSRRMDIH